MCLAYINYINVLIHILIDPACCAFSRPAMEHENRCMKRSGRCMVQVDRGSIARVAKKQKIVTSSRQADTGTATSS